MDYRDICSGDILVIRYPTESLDLVFCKKRTVGPKGEIGFVFSSLPGGSVDISIPAGKGELIEVVDVIKRNANDEDLAFLCKCFAVIALFF